jgi:trehalose 6-phosphate synthase
LKGTVEFMPIHFIHKSVSFDELISLYAVSDVCLVSSTRDGMNLVSYEYIATQRKRNGVMILSEFTGAAQSLIGSVVVNPWNTEELANALHDAVTMGDEQRKFNYEKSAAHVAKYTSAWWGQSFVEELARSEGGKRRKRITTRSGSVFKDIKKGLLAISVAPDKESVRSRDEFGGGLANRGAVQPVDSSIPHRQRKSASV